MLSPRMFVLLFSLMFAPAVGKSQAKTKIVQAPFRQQVNGSTPTGWLQLGTPKKWLLAIFDTGSDKLVAKTWETVASELAKVDQGVSGMVLPSVRIYNHGNSSSYQRKYMKDPKSGKQVPQQSEITYGSGSVITDVGSETVLIGNRKLDNFTLMEITQDSLSMLHTSKGIAGVLGLQHMKNKSLGNSLFSRMRDADLLTSFGYCHGSGNNGTFIWGDDSTEGQEMEVVGEMHWAVKIGSVKVGGSNKTAAAGSLLSRKRVSSISRHGKVWPFSNDGDAAESNDGDMAKALDGDGGDSESADDKMDKILGDMAKALGDDGDNALGDDGDMGGANDLDDEAAEYAAEDARVLADVCPDNSCTGILDTGSNIIAGPSAVMKSINNMINVKPDCSNFDSLPQITMTFGGMPVTLSPSGYVMKVPMPTQQEQDANDDGMVAEGEADGEGGSERVQVEMQPGYMRRHSPGAMGLAQSKEMTAQAATNRRWIAVFERINKNYGVDLRDTIKDMLSKHNNTNPEFMCMPALVPLDKHTTYGPLYVVGTPLLDSYYARWSFGKDWQNPKIHLQALKDAKVCKDDSDAAPARDSTSKAKDSKDNFPVLVRNRGPTVRRAEEIRYPHWAHELLHV